MNWMNRPLVGPCVGCAATVPCKCVDYPYPHRHWCQRHAAGPDELFCFQHKRPAAWQRYASKPEGQVK